MAKQTFKYFLNPGVSGDLHCKSGKFALTTALNQNELELLYEKEGQTQIITRIEMPNVSKKVEAEGSPEKKVKVK